MKTIGGLSLIVVLLLNHSLLAQGTAKAKKVLEWGWDEPDTKFIRANIGKMEQLPFDGVVFHVNSGKGGGLVWDVWGKRKFELAEFQHAIDDLKATPFRRITDRFLRVNVTPGSVDWFDDQAWGVVLGNFAVAAQIAKRGGCKGFMFDVEQYNDQLFDYGKQKHDEKKTFADYRAKVCQRGQEWMKAVNGAYPDIVLLLPYIYSITGGAAKDRAGASYGLLGDFVDGMLDACTPETRIVDAWEGAYTYKTKAQFEKAYESIKVELATLAADPEKYRHRIEAGFGIWMDCDWRGKGWSLTDFSKNHFTPAEFEKSVRAAMEVSDEYVWVYTEQPKWWTNEKLPREYVEALKKGRGKSSK